MSVPFGIFDACKTSLSPDLTPYDPAEPMAEAAGRSDRRGPGDVEHHVKAVWSRPSANKKYALAEADQAAPHLHALALEVLIRLPDRPRASPNLRALGTSPFVAQLPLHEAITLPWMAWDSRTHRNALLIDIDHDDALDRWLALPVQLRPHLVFDALSGRGHAILLLKDPVLLRTRNEVAAEEKGVLLCSSIGARSAPQRMAEWAGQLLAAALGGTLLPAGSLAKNPWGRTANLVGTPRWLPKYGSRPNYPEQWSYLQRLELMWAVRPGAAPAALRDITNALEPSYGDELATPSRSKTKRGRNAHREPGWLSRNTWVFDCTRFDAYEGGITQFDVILGIAHHHNSSMPDPLPGRDIAPLARSISRFMTSRYRPIQSVNRRHGRDRQEGAALNQKGRQQLAGRRSAAARAAANNHTIVAALAVPYDTKGLITQKKMTVATGLSLRTIKSRWHWILEVQDAAISGVETESQFEEVTSLPIR